MLGGEIFGANLPLIGSLLSGLKNNPLVKAISDFRTNWLQPLAQLIRENNLDIDGLVTLIEDSVIGVLTNLSDPSSNPFSLHARPVHDGSGSGHLHSSDIQFNLLDVERHTPARTSSPRRRRSSTSRSDTRGPSPRTRSISTSASRRSGSRRGSPRS